MLGAVTYCVAFAGLLAGCLVAALITDPADDGETHRSLGLGGCSLADELRRHATGPNDWASGDDEISFHDTAIITEGQRCGE